MLISGAESTQLFTGTATAPLQIVRVRLAPGGGAADGPVTVRVEGAGITTPRPAVLQAPRADQEETVDVPVAVSAPHRPGSVLPVLAIAESPSARAELSAAVTVAEPGWTVWMVSHFHYDPVWWGTQGQFTETRLLLPGDDGRPPEVATAFGLVRAHLDAARTDPDYKFVLAEIDYLKPYFDTHPEDRADLRALLADGRIEIVGGNYNEPNTNLTSAESTIRNAIYGIGHQRDVLGGDPMSAWMLDAFGFDPGYPGLMAAAGLTSSAWARGPHHQWGPRRTVGDNTRMQFASEFEWISPDGRGLLTSYMPNHYGAGWGIHRAADLAGARAEVLDQLASLAPVAATHNVLLPVGADHVIPARWATALHRDFRDRYLWPRCVTALPREFFAAVRDEAAATGVWLTPQTRDMNPVYPGKDVSYIDTKQAQRAAEIAVEDGERLATLAWLAGREYPAASLDKAWRQLVFGAHHDAITGTESDQVYLDLLGGWREAFERGAAERDGASAFLAGLAGTRPPLHADGARPLTVFQTLSWPRRGLARVTLAVGEPGTAWLAVYDDAGEPVPALAEGVRRHADGSLAEVTLTFLATLPALGYRTYWALPAPQTPPASGWVTGPGHVISNGTLEIAADPARGGTLTSILDLRDGRDVLTGPGNELLLQEEYDYHPRWGEGQWLLSPKGPGTGSAGAAASVRAQRCPIGSRLVAEFALGDLRVTQETLLWDGIDRVEFRTHVDGSIGSDRLLRVRFPAAVPGALPIYQTATAVIGRSCGAVDLDVAQEAFTLDTPAHEWFGLGSVARVDAGGRQHAIGVAEVILPAGDGTRRATTTPRLRRAVREFVAALAAKGVTATCSAADGPRYGALDVDSNLPDCRIAIGGPAVNPWTARLIASLGAADAAGLSGRFSTPGDTAAVWLPARDPRTRVTAPGADVRADRALPVLLVHGPDLATALATVTGDLGDAVIEAHAVGSDREPPLEHRTVALLNRGTPSGLVTPDGTLTMALMRASSAWPSGVWIDGEKRTVTDGSSFAWQHWSHTFEYALVCGAGDWREAGITTAGHEYNRDPFVCETTVHEGDLPARASLAEVTDADGDSPHPAVMLAALKPRGHPLASGRPGRPGRDAGITIRLRSTGTGGGTGTAPARVRLRVPVATARLTSLREDEEGPALPVRHGAIEALVPAAGMVTITAAPAATAGPATAADSSRTVPEGPRPEPAQPVFTRYWLHGKGPAPAGNLPVAVHLSPSRVSLPGPQAPPGRAAAGELAVTVACGPWPARGSLALDVPPGLVVERLDGGDGPLRYELDGGDHTRWDLSVRLAPGGAPGRYFVAARIGDEHGQLLEDAALVTVGEQAPLPEAPLEEFLPLLEADQRATSAELDVLFTPAALLLRPGESGAFTVRLANTTAAAVRGECQLLSPWGTWPLAGPWTRGFSAGPGEAVTLSYPVRVPAHARPGANWWALAKVAYFGRVRYSESARLGIRA